MRLVIISLLVILHISRYEVASEVIDTYTHIFRECIGSMKLQRQLDSKVVSIDSRKIREKGRGKRSIRSAGMRFAEVSGSCCWEVRTRKYGGDFMHLKTVETHSLPWEIKFVQLIKCSV